MTINSATRLLILNDSRSEAERLISMLHNAGRPVRAQHIDSPEALSKLLQEKIWDLMIGIDNCANVPPVEAIRLIKRLNKDVPVILQTDRDGSLPIVEGLKLGAADVVTLDEDQHLLYVIQRELSNRSQREERRFSERRFNEVVRNNQQLLDSSRDSIAFVQDGMFLYANESFAELLGHEAQDDIECMPVIDIVKAEDQSKVKHFLKEFMIKGSDIEATELKFVAQMSDGTDKPLAVDVCKSTYEEEACIQFLIRAKAVNNQELEAQLEQIKNKDMASGLFNKHYLVDNLDSVVGAAINKKYNSALFHIGIDNFLDTVQQKLGIASIDAVIAKIAAFAKTMEKDNEVLCRFNEDSLILLVPKTSASKALERAQKMCQTLRDNIIDVDGSTLQFNYHIGIALITETSTNSDVPIEHAVKALDLIRTLSENDGTILAKIYEPEAKKQTKDDIQHMVQTALSAGRFKLLFQPILSLRGSNKEHYEVLLRMMDEQGNEVSPNEFLSTAAKIGATTKLDRWVILESIKILSGHRSKGNNTHLIVNLSRESVLDATLPPWLGVAFKAAKLPPDALIFQMREIDVNDHLNVASTFTQQLKSLGCSTSISHFGCALNPFNALKNLEISHVKVDGSFTQDLQNNSDDENSLNELVSELHQNDKITIVPFVENASILSKLWQSGVHYIQGFYLQEPTDQMDYDFDMES
ncbi:GGDEF/EAL domain-containing response regulator [Agarilytica rhodophyticola]|uniref:GGDEF/EAL domain-containing response regulator n=1 Tax=Agarilytica rhodophyticola TaxID=1737490 RepID=UPI000B344C3D|nr:EAL domain-containing protein [Agarilytica rhodophyticola]